MRIRYPEKLNAASAEERILRNRFYRRYESVVGKAWIEREEDSIMIAVTMPFQKNNFSGALQSSFF